MNQTHKCNLIHKTRKAALMIMTISFVALVTGLTLNLHLLSHKHQDSRCSTCQLLQTAPAKFAPEPQIIALDTALLENNIEFPSQSPVITFRHEPFGPRPPPNRPGS